MSSDFIKWYKKQHGYEPFPWQVRLAMLISAETPPESISVPTGSGKTAIIAIWQWAQETGLNVPTRLIYVVDRRLIVDSVTDYAEQLGCNVIKMRGGVTIDNSWMMAPHKPAVIVSTVDQVGSKLLWRGYGVSPKTAPIHAALVGNDALIVLDEAHISTPFQSTLYAVKQLRGDSTLPWHVISMTATPTEQGETLELSDADHKNPVLRKRLESHKLAKLIKADKTVFVARLVAEAQTLQESGAKVIGVICNTTGDARRVFNRLTGDKVLLTGRIRPADKDAILEKHLPRIVSGSRDNRNQLYVVATQTIEVGADLDFDALVTQSAPIDALRQRFGRLDRLGEMGTSHATIIHKDLGASDECRVYGKALLKSTWSWLGKVQSGKGKTKLVDFGINKMHQTIIDKPPPVRDTKPTRELTVNNLRQLRQTVPTIPVDIEPWLHGDNTDDITVSVVWREDLGDDHNLWPEIINAAYPVIAEAMPCPVYEIRSWLGNRTVVADGKVITGKNITPGSTLVLPSSYGGYGPWGWDPQSLKPVEDIGNLVGARVRLIGADENTDIKEALKNLDIDINNPVCNPYPGGLIVTPANRRVDSKAVRLEDHMRGIREVAAELTSDQTIIQAAHLHDIGKKDTRFQVLLGAREESLAKSGHVSPWAARQAREWSGLPVGWRHELASVAMLPTDASDLLRYLVGTHHGHARAVLPIGGDIDLWEQAGGPKWGNMTERLNDEHGAWGLAYMEALVRLSDWIQSKQEQSDV